MGRPIDPATLIYHFTGCTGRAAALTDFDAVKQLSESAALQLTDGSATVVLMEATDAATGAVLSNDPGVHHNNLPTATCKPDQPPRTGADVVVLTRLMAAVKE